MRTAVIFDLDGCLVDARAVFLSCVAYAFDKLGLEQRTPEELLPYLGPPFHLAFGELLGVPPDAPLVASVIAAYRERYATAMLTETTVEPGIPEALATLVPDHRLAGGTSHPKAVAQPPPAAVGRPGPAPPARAPPRQAEGVRGAAAGRDGHPRALRGHRRPAGEPSARAQGGDARPRAARARLPAARGDGRRPPVRRARRARARNPVHRRHVGDREHRGADRGRCRRARREPRRAAPCRGRPDGRVDLRSCS